MQINNKQIYERFPHTIPESLLDTESSFLREEADKSPTDRCIWDFCVFNSAWFLKAPVGLPHEPATVGCTIDVEWLYRFCTTLEGSPSSWGLNFVLVFFEIGSACSFSPWERCVIGWIVLFSKAMFFSEMFDSLSLHN